MRLVLVFLLLSTLIFSQYSDPPLSNVTDYNLAAAGSLDGVYNASQAQNGTITLVFGSYSQHIPLSASADIAGMSLMVDNVTYPAEGLSAILARGYSQGHLTSLPGYGDFYCDSYISSSGCDFDDDSCVEYETRTFVLYDLDATFTFRNTSETVAAESNVVEVPDEVLKEMERASGADPLNVSLSGHVTFIYEINNRIFDGNCSNNLYNRSASVDVSANRSFPASGNGKLFILVAPVLREQWFRDNHFDVVLLSQSPIYSASIYQDGNISRNLTLRNFSVASNSYGLQEIFSEKMPQADWVENSSFVVTPLQLEPRDDSFLYVYMFNHSYQGIGSHLLSLVVNDSFGGSAEYTENLSSVMLSYNGSTTETGESIYAQPSRKSASVDPESLVRLDVSLGIVALILLLAFVNTWLLR